MNVPVEWLEKQDQKVAAVASAAAAG
jgi:hypothetical protein